MLTYEQAAELLTYDSETGLLRWNKSGLKRTKGKIAGHTDRTGYTRIMINYKMYLAHRLIWLLVYKQWPVSDLDHIDRNPRNNRIENLREVTHLENMRNSKIRKDNTTGVRGVYLQHGRYCVNVRGVYLGSFTSLNFAKQIAERAQNDTDS